MKTLKTTLLLSMILMVASPLLSQVDYLKQVHGYLDKGDCDGAQTYYDLYRGTHPADSDLEIAIAVCRSQREQDEKYNQMVASYEKALQELQVSESGKFEGMKTVYQALLSNDCDKAYQAYIECQLHFGLEDADLENQIKDCRKIKAENEKPKATEGVQEVGDLEYCVYLNGTKMSWNSASEAAKKFRIGGHSDWRVPTVSELQIVLQQMDKESYMYVEERHWSSDMTLYKDGSGKCYYVYKRTNVDGSYFENKTPIGLCYCILVRTKK